MYCMKCGAELVTDAVFCAACGTHVAIAEEKHDAPRSIDEVGSRGALGRSITAVPTLPNKEQLLAGVLVVGLIIGFAYWFLVERNVAREPDYKVGDTWTFVYPPIERRPEPTSFAVTPETKKMIEEAILNQELEQTYTVARSDDLGFYAKKVTGKLDGWAGLPLPLWKSRAWKSRATKNDLDYQEYPFPLKPGQTWKEMESNESNANGTRVVSQVEILYSIGEWEDVVAPAGVFRSLPVRVQTTIKSTGKITVTSVYETVSWYSPEAKMDVKSERNGKVTSQLKSYSVK